MLGDGSYGTWFKMVVEVHDALLMEDDQLAGHRLLKVDGHECISLASYHAAYAGRLELLKFLAASDRLCVEWSSMGAVYGQQAHVLQWILQLGTRDDKYTWFFHPCITACRESDKRRLVDWLFDQLGVDAFGRLLAATYGRGSRYMSGVILSRLADRGLLSGDLFVTSTDDGRQRQLIDIAHAQRFPDELFPLYEPELLAAAGFVRCSAQEPALSAALASCAQHDTLGEFLPQWFDWLDPNCLPTATWVGLVQFAVRSRRWRVLVPLQRRKCSREAIDQMTWSVDDGDDEASRATDEAYRIVDYHERHGHLPDYCASHNRWNRPSRRLLLL